MKKLYAILLVAPALLPAGIAAQTNVLYPTPAEGQSVTIVSKSAQARTDAATTAPAASTLASDFAPYYPAPDGVYYLGLKYDGSVPPAEYALAPTNADITFHCTLDLNDGDYEWTYINPSGRETDVENQDIVMNVANTSLVDAPYVYAWTYSGSGGYTMARGGIAFGYGYLPDGSNNEYYSSNINSVELYSTLFDPATLSVNYEEAGTNFADNYPLKISDVTIKGFGELFRYAAPYKFDAIRTDVIYADTSGSNGDPSHLVAEIYPYSTENGVDFSNRIALYTGASATKYDTYQGMRYVSFEFTPSGDAPVISQPVMVIIRPTEGNENIISPNIYAGLENHEGEPGTAFIYASYTRGGQHTEDGCLGYYGIQHEGYRYPVYSSHWNVSGKLNYDVKPSGVGNIAAEVDTDENAPVYNLTGVKVGTQADMDLLPAGLYIVKGKKILVRK